MFYDINHKMLAYPKIQPNAIDILTKLTIFPDLKLYAVPSKLFFEDNEDELLKEKG